MFVKFVFFVCCFASSYTQEVLPSCRQYEFVDEESLLEFESCDGVPNVFGIKSYADVLIEPYKFEAEKYLSTIQTGYSCFRTKQVFNFDSNTEVDSIIYLDSYPEDSESYVEILAIDTQGGVYPFDGKITPSDEWQLFHKEFTQEKDNAQIEVHAFTTADAVLAIEYLHIVNPRKAETPCRRTTTSTTTTTTTTTTSTTTTTTTTSTTTTTTTTTTEPDPPTSETDETESTTTETESTTTEANETESTTTEADETESTTTEADETESTTPETGSTNTGIEPTLTPIPTDPIDSNGDVVWTILSFTFLVTTVIAAAVLLYLVYLYKTAVLASNSLIMKSALTSSNLPRLTVANTSSGEHVIVGIESNAMMKPKYF